jgi:hypothetical protein
VKRSSPLSEHAPVVYERLEQGLEVCGILYLRASRVNKEFVTSIGGSKRWNPQEKKYARLPRTIGSNIPSVGSLFILCQTAHTWLCPQPSFPVSRKTLLSFTDTKDLNLIIPHWQIFLTIFILPELVDENASSASLSNRDPDSACA